MTEARNGNGEHAPQGKVVEKGKRQLLIAPRRGIGALRAGVAPLSATALKGMLGGLAGIDVVRVLKPKKVVQAFSAGTDQATDVYVVRADKDRAELLKQAAPPNMIVEEDAFLDYGSVVTPLRVGPQGAQPSAVSGVTPRPIRFRVVDDAGKPVPHVKVTLTGDAFPTEGETNQAGEIQLDLVALPGGRARALYVKPPRGYWDRFLTTPDLSATEVNVIRLLSLESTLPGFPAEYKHGWGQRLMGLDAMPSHVTGKGIKIAIIDSGADNTHPLLRHLTVGVDCTNGGDTTSWAKDTVGHGSHCAGVIAARSAPGFGLCGFAPEAEIHVFKIFPGGQFSSLLEALDECMARDIDIINMSLGSPQVSEAVEQKLEECVLDGIACIVAAGNSGDGVQYPASSPNVLAVAALGKLKEFPSEAWDTQTVVQGRVTPDGLFSPSFTCFGPQVGVCAPGVAIVSTVPDSAFEPQSGTSMAAPHVTGMAALLLAHHPLFQSTLRARGPERVAALFQALKSLCVPLPLGAERTGFGMPTLAPLVNVLQPIPDGAAATPEASTAAPETPKAPPAAAAGVRLPGAAPAPGAFEQALAAQQLSALLQHLLSQQPPGAPPMRVGGAPSFPGASPLGGFAGVPTHAPQGQMGGFPVSHPFFWGR